MVVVMDMVMAMATDPMDTTMERDLLMLSLAILATMVMVVVMDMVMAMATGPMDTTMERDLLMLSLDILATMVMDMDMVIEVMVTMDTLVMDMESKGFNAEEWRTV